MVFNFCPYCGNKLENGYKFCPYCGEKLAGQEERASTGSDRSKDVHSVDRQPENNYSAFGQSGNAYGDGKQSEDAQPGIRQSEEVGSGNDGTPEPCDIGTAQNVLGWKHEFGIEVEKDYSKAVAQYRLSASNGNSVGQFNLGRMYFYGYGVEQDTENAFKWFALSAQSENADALCYLAYLYDKGIVVESDENKAATLYYHAANEGSLAALYALWEHPEFKDIPEVRDLFTENKDLLVFSDAMADVTYEAKNGNALAQIILADDYIAKGGDKNLGCACNWLRLAAKNGDPKGMHSLAKFYEEYGYYDEKGKPSDKSSAPMDVKTLIGISASQGYPPAIKWVLAEVKFSKGLADEFARLCERLSKYPKEELDAFFNDDDDEEEE